MIPNAPPTFIRHRRRRASVPTKYDVCTSAGNDLEYDHYQLSQKKTDHICSPGRFPLDVLRPPDAAKGKPSQVQCARRLETTRTTRSLSGPKRNQPHIRGADFFLESGNVLLSRAVSSQVPSALKGLTSVFGMGTGGSLSPLSPECLEGFVQAFVLLASVPSLYNRDFHLGNPPHNRASLFYCAYPENRTSRSLTPC